MAPSKEKEKTPYEEEAEDSEESEEINRDAGDSGDDAVSEQAGTEEEEEEDVSAPVVFFEEEERTTQTRRALSPCVLLLASRTRARAWWRGRAPMRRHTRASARTAAVRDA